MCFVAFATNFIFDLIKGPSSSLELEVDIKNYSLKGGDPAPPSDSATLLRLHPSHWSHLRRLPPFQVRIPASGAPNSHGVTGGVYKARERIHRGMLIRDY